MSNISSEALRTKIKGEFVDTIDTFIHFICSLIFGSFMSLVIL